MLLFVGNPLLRETGSNDKNCCFYENKRDRVCMCKLKGGTELVDWEDKTGLRIWVLMLLVRKMRRVLVDGEGTCWTVCFEVDYYFIDCFRLYLSGL